MASFDLFSDSARTNAPVNPMAQRARSYPRVPKPLIVIVFLASLIAMLAFLLAL